MQTTAKTSRKYLATPIFGVLMGLVYLVALSVAGNPVSGVLAFAVMVAFSGGLLLARRRSETVRGLVDWLASGLIEGTIAAAEGLSEPEQVRAHPARIVRFSTQAAACAAELKRFLTERVYCSDAVVQVRAQAAYWRVLGIGSAMLCARSIRANL